MQVKNVFVDCKPPTIGELFSTILRHKNVHIERIVSSTSFSPCDYLQEQDEWVILLEGKAVMTIAGERVELCSGDHVFLPSGLPHSVLSASDGAVWLAVHVYDPKEKNT